MDRRRQKRILGFIVNMKMLIKKHGLRKVQFWYRYLPAILKGDAITNQRWSSERVFDDEIFWKFFSEIRIDVSVGFEFDEGFSFRCNFSIPDFAGAI